MQTMTLSDGNSIPILGLGSWMSAPHAVGNAVEFAITTASYRHIDCASAYGNEKEIGTSLAAAFAKVKRKEIFITSKLWNSFHRSKNVERACKQTLSDLNLDYLDMYLMHWGIAFKPGGPLEPIGKDGKVITEDVPIRETWQAMEDLVKKGLVKSIGVANFTTAMLLDLLTYARVKPVMNQIELHPYNAQTDLIEFCKYKHVAVTAYSPLARQGAIGGKEPRLFDEPLIARIARRHKKTHAQVVLRWAIQRGTIAIPKSTTPERIMENKDIFDFALTGEDMEHMTSLNRNYRFVDPILFWKIPYFI